ncbi:MAG: hypothetical protein KDD21_11800 [Bacteroidetes bacterium]|nr:hypothetical protein [Bacteroidota bacterium]
MISTFNLLTNRYYFSAGMIRSGSTLLYNILRIILQMKYNGNISCGWIDDYDKLEKNRRYLIKTHSINRKLVFGAEHIFYTYRDIRECLLSFKIRFGTEPTKALCDSQIN